ncbi:MULTISPECIES: hypothetical protein [unclassified Flavobacterium]|uniref:hypothetical protein n=1 Tax=unclassified Flavobacterium TaxID=196869 RepID=UPI001F13D73D|nr:MULTISPECIES: hypothetical protein [unclassified Flavobacterium]UMY64667.1 hypothetical protein MKO97_09095 [Flavobacterium sp. HJ-32-4]
MKKWKKEEALNALNDLINDLKGVRLSGRKSPEHTRWLANALRILEEIFGNKSRYCQTLASFSWRETGTRIVQGWDIEYEMEQHHVQAFLAQLNQAEGLLLAAQDQLRASDIDDVYEDKTQAIETSELITIINLGEKKLRKLIRETPAREKEIQDKFEDLLLGNDIDYAKEFPHIMYSSKQYIPDFSFERMSLAVEIKLCKSDEKGLIAQLNDDILAYRTKFKNILFIIYDLGNIRDVDNFNRSFDSYDDVIIQVIKH